MNKWVLCGLCIFMLIIILFSSCSSCSCKENMANMDPLDYIGKIVSEMKKHEKKQTEFKVNQYVLNYLNLRKPTVEKMISLLDTLSFDILKKKIGVSDDNTITKLKDNLNIIHGEMK